MNDETKHTVKILPPEVARKIAAGEVIDRPNAIVRELLDNAIDSGAKNIILEIAGGGIDKIRVTDDGCGMSKEDLKNSIKPHATSKISTEQDLLALNTMGFRGEALPSIAAVSRLEITTKQENEDTAFKLTCHIESEDNITEAVLEKGTIVQALSLFENFPARRVFLKRPASEGLLCKQTFIEKSLAFPQIAFRFISDGQIKMDLPATNSQTQRCIQALELKNDEEQFHCIEKTDEIAQNWNFSLIIGDSSIIKNDRKNIHIFVNGRKITEYSLMQAIEYGVTGSFPNGTHPVACLFLNINPALVDFNIHPAKKEARFKDLSAVHHAISSETRKVFTNENISIMKSSANDSFEEQNYKLDIINAVNESTEKAYHDYKFHQGYGTHTNYTRNPEYGKSSFSTEHDTEVPHADYANIASVQESEFVHTASQEISSHVTQNKSYDFRYIGNLFNVFLLVEKNECLYAIDQHAGHERILYEELLEKNAQIQPLLFPFDIDVESEVQDEYLESIKEKMTEAGFTLKKDNGKWTITTVPIKWQGKKKDLQEALFEKLYEPEEFMRHFLATCACKAAIKEGHYIDPDTACQLIEKIFALKDPHCPHGRPIWFTLSKQQMYALVKRT